jgi:quercetin dioxygenase-like cupin family protein
MATAGRDSASIYCQPFADFEWNEMTMSDHQPLVTNIHELPAETFEWGAIKWLCNSKLSPNAAQTLGLRHILPGQRNPLHYHPNCEELLYVLAGQGRHRLDDEVVELRTGMTIRIPIGVRHNFENTGWEPLVSLITFSSGDRQTVFLE